MWLGHFLFSTASVKNCIIKFAFFIAFSASESCTRRSILLLNSSSCHRSNSCLKTLSVVMPSASLACTNSNFSVKKAENFSRVTSRGFTVTEGRRKTGHGIWSNDRECLSNRPALSSSQVSSYNWNCRLLIWFHGWTLNDGQDHSSSLTHLAWAHSKRLASFIPHFLLLCPFSFPCIFLLPLFLLFSP